MKPRNWIKLHFLSEDLDGRTVEFETEGKGLALGTLLSQRNDGELIAIQIRVTGAGSGATPPEPLDELFSFETLRRHPFPERAEFLLLKNEAEILSRIQSDMPKNRPS